MPLLKHYRNFFIILKNKKIPASVLFETPKKIGLELLENSEMSTSESRVECEVLQGNYECYFQSKILDMDYDIIHSRYILILEYPPFFRRTLKSIPSNN